MIILDTNVISEMMAASPDKLVSAWLGRQKLTKLYTTWINIAEIRRGLTRLPNDRRKTALSNKFEDFVEQAFATRVLSFQKESAF